LQHGAEPFRTKDASFLLTPADFGMKGIPLVTNGKYLVHNNQTSSIALNHAPEYLLIFPLPLSLIKYGLKAPNLMEQKVRILIAT
jgi:hypothetical protein